MTTTRTSKKQAAPLQHASRRARPILRRSLAVLAFAVLATACSSTNSDVEGAADTAQESTVEAGSDEAVNESVEPTDDGDAQDGIALGGSTEQDGAASDDSASGAEADRSDDADQALAATPLCEAEPPLAGSRVELLQSGNRIAPGSIDFTQLDETVVELPDTAIWVTADPTVAGGWYVVLERGSAVRVSPQGAVTTTLDSGEFPPEFSDDRAQRSPFRWHELFDDPLPDGRVVTLEDIAAVLATPSDIYQHGVLGDEIEAAAIEWIDTCTGEGGRIEIPEPDVIEGISPMLVDIDRDGQTEVVVTLSNASAGARLAAFELDGSSAGESEPIGRANRWRNILAVGAFGPGGEVEIIEVRTPHLGGVVQSFRQIQDDEFGPTLVQVAQSNPSYTSHVIGSRNLSMGIGVDANDDGFPDVLVASASRDSVVAMRRTNELDTDLQGWQIIGEQPLDNQLTSNIASQEETAGRATIAVADDDLLRIWR